MAIITISRGSYSKGKEVAQRLGYDCICPHCDVRQGLTFVVRLPEEKGIVPASGEYEHSGARLRVAFCEQGQDLEREFR